MESRQVPEPLVAEKIRRLRHVAGGLIVGACALMMIAGCAGKASRRAMVFDLDKVFSRQTDDYLDHSRLEEEGAWKETGLLLADQRDYERAIEAFMRYVEGSPEEYFGFNAIAVCYKKIRDYPMAMKNFERALEFTESKEDRAKVLANIGNLYISTNKPQAALGYYKEAASLFEKNPLYLIFIARTFILLDEPERARKVLATAEETQHALTEHEPEDEKGLGHYLMAYCFAALGEEEKVLKYIGRALAVNPNRYMNRIEKDLQDSQNLFYSLRDHADLRALLDKCALKIAPGRWLEND